MYSPMPFLSRRAPMIDTRKHLDSTSGHDPFSFGTHREEVLGSSENILNRNARQQVTSCQSCFLQGLHSHVFRTIDGFRRARSQRDGWDPKCHESWGPQGGHGPWGPTHPL